MPRLPWESLILLLGLVACTRPAEVPTKPASPTAFAARAVSWNRVDLDWDRVNGASGYVLERKTGASDGAYVPLASLAAPQHSFSDPVSPATTYTYRLRAVNSAREGAAAVQTVTVPVAPPENPATFAATAPAHNRVVLSWSGAMGAAEYRLERATGGGTSYAQLSVFGAGECGYTDASVTANTLYTYRLVAINASGTSSGLTRPVQTPPPPSPSPDPQSPAPPPSPPSTPSGFTAISISQREIRLSWQPVQGAEEYRLERKTGSNSFSPLGTALGTVCSDTSPSSRQPRQCQQPGGSHYQHPPCGSG